MERPPMNQEQFDKQFAYERPHYEKTPCTRVASVTKKFWRPFTSPRNFANTVVSFIPILHWLPRYDFKKNLLSDAIRGVTVGIMHVPQGIAYAILAGVDPVVGLYTSLFPALLYMIFGTSRHCSTGNRRMGFYMLREAEDHQNATFSLLSLIFFSMQFSAGPDNDVFYKQSIPGFTEVDTTAYRNRRN